MATTKKTPAKKVTAKKTVAKKPAVKKQVARKAPAVVPVQKQSYVVAAVVLIVIAALVFLALTITRYAL